MKKAAVTSVLQALAALKYVDGFQMDYKMILSKLSPPVKSHVSETCRELFRQVLEKEVEMQVFLFCKKLICFLLD